MSLHRCLFRPSPNARAALALTVVALAAMTAAAPAPAADRSEVSRVAAGSGLRADDAAWPRWQGRVTLDSGRGDLPNGGPSEPGFGTGFRSQQSLSLLGDYYFKQQGLAARSAYSGGFRASGGLFVGARQAVPRSMLPGSSSGLGSGFSAERRNFSLWSPAVAPDGGDASTHSIPYLGVGYTGLRSLRGTGGGWGFSADLGVMALQPRSAVRLGQQSIGDTVRELQISPLLQLGVSYSF